MNIQQILNEMAAKDIKGIDTRLSAKEIVEKYIENYKKRTGKDDFTPLAATYAWKTLKAWGNLSAEKRDEIKEILGEINPRIINQPSNASASQFEMMILDKLKGKRPDTTLRQVRINMPKELWERLNNIARKWGLIKESKERPANKPGITELRKLKKDIINSLSQTKLTNLKKSDVEYKGKLIEVKKANPVDGMAINFAEIIGLKNKTQASKLTGRSEDDLTVEYQGDPSRLKDEDLKKLAEEYNKFQDWFRGELERIILPKLKSAKPYLCIGTSIENSVIYKPSEYSLAFSRPEIDDKVKGKENKGTQRAQYGNFGRVIVKARVRGSGTKLIEISNNPIEYFTENIVDKYIGLLLKEFKQ